MGSLVACYGPLLLAAEILYKNYINTVRISLLLVNNFEWKGSRLSSPGGESRAEAECRSGGSQAINADASPPKSLIPFRLSLYCWIREQFLAPWSQLCTGWKLRQACFLIPPSPHPPLLPFFPLYNLFPIATAQSPHGSGLSAETVLWAKVKVRVFPREKANPIFLQGNGGDGQIDPCSWSGKTMPRRGKRTSEYPSQKGEGFQFPSRFFFQNSFPVT